MEGTQGASRVDADVWPATVTAKTEVFTPHISAQVLWDTFTLGVAAFVWTAVITVVGVIVAARTRSWLGLAGYGVGALGGVVLGLRKPQPIIRLIRRFSPAMPA